MAAFNPFYSEETGHIPLDELAPWQQALMNPGANNPGMSMPGYDQNLMSMLGNQSAGVNPGAGTGGSMMSPDPYTWTGPQNSGAGNAAFNNVFNSGTTQRNTPTIASPSLLATNMSMTGAENVGGMGMYTGSNGPLDTTRFTPVQGQQQNGPPPGSIPTGDPNTWITPWGATYTTPGSVNNSSSAAYDAYRQRAFGDMMGPMGRGPSSNPYQELTDVLRLAPGSINAQTFQGYLGSLQGQQTGPNPPQQTAPLPPQGGNSQRPGQPGQSVQNPYLQPLSQLHSDPQYQQYQNFVGQVTQQMGLGNRGLSPEERQMVIQRVAQLNPAMGQYGRQLDNLQNQYSNYDTQNPQSRPPGMSGAGGQSPVIGSPGMMGPMNNQQLIANAIARGQISVGANGQLVNSWTGGPNIHDQSMRAGQMQVDPAQMAAQFSSDPASQQAYLRDMFGGGQQGGQQYQSPQNVDFRAATFGGGSIFPATAGSGGNNIPNTTNPVNTQYSTPQAGFGGATNRRGGFGGMSLFGNQFGSGGSTGFGGTQPSQYRGAGTYGRPASYGQSQRPY